MAGANLELPRQGGRFNTEVGQLLASTDVDRIGAMGLQTLMHWFMMLFRDEANGLPISGFPRDEFDRDYCRATGTGGLGYSVSTGWGMGFIASALATDEFEPMAYLPIVVSSALTGSLAAHDPTNPRIDILCLEPTYVNDQSASKNVKDPNTLIITSQSIAQRRRFGSTLTVVTGTPAASPVPPAVPAGKTIIARAFVPATSGAASFSDARPVLEIGHLFKGVTKYHTRDFVPLGASTELLVEATSPATMAVLVNPGRANINGMMRGYARINSLAIGASHATQERQDIVVARESGVIDVVAGSNAPVGTSTPPATPANATRLAIILVDPTVTTIASAKVTDARLREPFTGFLMQDRSVGHKKMAIVPVRITASAGAPSGNTSTITLNFFHPDGTTAYAREDAGGQGIKLRVKVHKMVSNTAYVGTEYDMTNPDLQALEFFDGPDTDNAKDHVGLSFDSPFQASGELVSSNGLYYREMHILLTESSMGQSPFTVKLRRKDNTVTGTFRVTIEPVEFLFGIGGTVTVTFA